MITPVWSMQNDRCPVVPGIAGRAAASKVSQPAVQPAGTVPVNAVAPAYLNQYPLLGAVTTVALERTASSSSEALQEATAGGTAAPPLPSMARVLAKPML